MQGNGAAWHGACEADTRAKGGRPTRLCLRWRVRSQYPTRHATQRVDLSWTFWPPPPPAEEGEEPAEEPALEFNLIFYNKDVSATS